MLTMLFKYIINGCCLEGKGDKAALGGGGTGEKISFSNLEPSLQHIIPAVV
jgi:hypothetical protein